MKKKFRELFALPLSPSLSSHDKEHPVEEWMQGLRLGDEWANCLTHAFGLLLSLMGLFLLVFVPLSDGDHWKLINFAVYGATLVLLYGASTLYHSLHKPRLKKIFRTVDHCAIYLSDCRLLYSFHDAAFTRILGMDIVWHRLGFGFRRDYL